MQQQKLLGSADLHSANIGPIGANIGMANTVSLPFVNNAKHPKVHSMTQISEVI